MAIAYKLANQNNPVAISALFDKTFSDSESANEGKLIGRLADNLIETTPENDIAVFTGFEEDRLVGCIIFTRLRFEGDARQVYLLSPVAISSDQQRRGIGTELICFGLQTLGNFGVDIAVTYGDPDYYERVGFKPIDAAIIPAPLVLEQPHGWLAQSLTDEEIYPFQGPARCAEALNDPAYW